jgi:hypothetical protein
MANVVTVRRMLKFLYGRPKTLRFEMTRVCVGMNCCVFGPLEESSWTSNRGVGVLSR